MICQSCGGIVGRDCFNPDECAWITMQMQAEDAARRELERHGYREYLKMCERDYGDHLRQEWCDHIGFDPIAMGM